MSDEEVNVTRPTSDPTPQRKRISFSSLTQTFQETISRRNLSAPPSGGDDRPPRPKRRNRFSSPPSTSAQQSSRQLPIGYPVRGPFESRRPANRNSPRASVASFARTILGRTSTPTTASSTNHSSETELAATSVRNAMESTSANYKRYSAGDLCLVDCGHSRTAHLVNRHGFPAGKGITPAQQRGPYQYVLASVKKRHFDEDAEYYTVSRADTFADQRADVGWMVPIQSGSRGYQAASDAAKQHRRDVTAERDGSDLPGTFHGSAERGGSKIIRGVETCFCFLLAPFVWCFGLKRFAVTLGHFIKRQAKQFLYGEKPYGISVRITAVNVVVFCNTWVMFVDQIRLAFLPPEADFSLAVISCIFWVVLVIELLVELFIRPEDYQTKIISEEAYDPRTVRFINSFHLFVESVALFAFVPEFACLFTKNFTCGDRPGFSFFNAGRMSVLGPERMDTFYGRAFFALCRLRVFGLVRHWKKMWTTNTFVHMKTRELGLLMPSQRSSKTEHRRKRSKRSTNEADEEKQKHDAFTNASHIGTGLMVVNSHRAMTVFFFIFGLFPLLFCFQTNGGSNPVSDEMVKLLQENNLGFDTEGDLATCLHFGQSLTSWAVGVTTGNSPNIHSETDVYLLSLEILPKGRCDQFFGGFDGPSTVYACQTLDNNQGGLNGSVAELCEIWGYPDGDTSNEGLAERAGIRTGAITTEVESEMGTLTFNNGTVVDAEYRVVAKFNDTFSVEPAAFGSFLLQLSLLVYILGFLSILRRDARVLVLGPLRRMLRIVARYAKNPLGSVKRKSLKNLHDDTDSDKASSSDEDGLSENNDLGSFETEQLINAVSKITDLLRKCWGVAGAGIISTSLAREQEKDSSMTVFFNFESKGNSVFAVFAFCAVNAFDHYLRALGGDVMILINDVASVLHSEVFRWGLGDSGQCNKNLGSAWLMVFRIGDVEEVSKKLDEATNVVFSNTQKTVTRGELRRRKGKDSSLVTTDGRRRRKKGNREKSTSAMMNLSLAQLPGISAFADRALIGILKTFAGIYRDDKLLNWKKDFRLGAGVGAFSVNMIFGMDAGWAQEGAVGSEYKVDATYLSPHVNMASRMMSACKQYGVSVLLSQAVQELLSDVARSKLRHLDTVTVKGSSVRQRIYTYDARHKGVDFFLFGKTDAQADNDSDQYNANIWNTDQDLTAMRQHVEDDFLGEFDKGREAYLSGHWSSATKHLENANEILLQNMVEEGYIEYELNELQSHALDEDDARLAEQEFRNETEDGPSRRLLAYMKSCGGEAPDDWEGFRPLTSK